MKRLLASLAAILLFPVLASAQEGSVVLDNYGLYPLGSQAALQGGAYIARAKGSEATWYNLAGLNLKGKSTISGNASIYNNETLIVDNQGTQGEINSISAFLGGVESTMEDIDQVMTVGYSVAMPNAFNNTIKFEGRGQVTSNLDYSDPNLTVDGIIDTAEITSRSNSGYSVFAPGIGVALPLSGQTSLGFGLRYYDVTVTSLDTWSIYEDWNQTNITAFYNQVGNYAHVGSAQLLRFEGSLQGGLGENLKYGLNVRGPSMQLGSKGEISYYDLTSQDVLQGFTYTRGTYLSLIEDNQVEFQYKLPLEVGLGLAFVSEGLELELDLLYFGSIAEYKMFDSTEMFWQYQDHTTIADGSAAVDPTMNSAESVLNLALGGQMRLSETSQLDFGYYTSKSPQSKIGANVDIQGLSFGTTWKKKMGTTSLGVVASQGKSNENSDRQVDYFSLGLIVAGTLLF